MDAIKKIQNRKPGEPLDLRRANLSGANLRNADLSGANLRGADLSGANLRGVDLCNADLSGANLRGVDLCNANLRRANLRGVDLSGADLSKADLRFCIGNNRTIRTIQTGSYVVNLCGDQMAIGCKQFSLDQWWEFTDEEIDAMDSDALGFWKKWKPILQAITA